MIERVDAKRSSANCISALPGAAGRRDRCRLSGGLPAARLGQFHRALCAFRHHALESRHRIEFRSGLVVWPADDSFSIYRSIASRTSSISSRHCRCPLSLLSSLLIGSSYSAALIILLLPGLRFDPKLSSMRDLELLGLVAAISAAFVALSYVAMMTAAGLLTVQGICRRVSSLLGRRHDRHHGRCAVRTCRFDAPAECCACRWRRRFSLPPSSAPWRWCSAMPESSSFNCFTSYFLPIIWMAVRTGSEGVTIGIVVTQLGLILGSDCFSG